MKVRKKRNRRASGALNKVTDARERRGRGKDKDVIHSEVAMDTAGGRHAQQVDRRGGGGASFFFSRP